VGANRVANKAPYTDQELQRIIDACDNLGDVVWSNGRESGVYTGEDVKDFIWMMAYTGLRVSDVGLFNMSRLKGNEVFLRPKKNGGDVFAYIPDWLRDRLNAWAKRRADVADLLGDDEKTVREHYSRWVPERQARLTKILKDAFDDKPKPKLVAIRAGSRDRH